jgi:hypothetical protein|tara:strand:- start:440 stop:868 length:429 start_codon:yes stop_codon:yes gene_type:complete
MIDVITTANSAKVLAAIKKAQPTARVSERALGRAATGHILDMLRRVDKGVGLGGRFKPYHPLYAEYRAEKGRSTSAVNLQFTGEMFADVSLKKTTSTEAVIGFSKEIERRKAASNQKNRPWFGVTDQEQKRIVSRFKREFFK